MSIIIQNISGEDVPECGENKYIVRINTKVICEFIHDRRVNGLAQCLRDAAAAVVAEEKKDKADMLKNIMQITSSYGCLKGEQ